MYIYILAIIAVIYCVYNGYKNNRGSSEREELILQKKQHIKNERLKIRSDIEDLSRNVREIQMYLKENKNIIELKDNIAEIKNQIDLLVKYNLESRNELDHAIDNLKNQTSILQKQIVIRLNSDSQSQSKSNSLHHSFYGNNTWMYEIGGDSHEFNENRICQG
jgi:predicted RNase H-like nuclease (RuvC/YqgF family)